MEKGKKNVNMRTYKRRNILKESIEPIEGVLGLCRLCLEQANDSVPIFANRDDICTSLATRIMICVGYEITQEDFLPNTICAECHKELNNYYEFRKKCNRTFHKLKTHLFAVKSRIANKLKAKQDEEKTDLVHNSVYLASQSFCTDSQAAGQSLSQTVNQPISTLVSQSVAVSRDQLILAFDDITQLEFVHFEPGCQNGLAINIVDDNGLMDATVKHCAKEPIQAKLPIEVCPDFTEFLSSILVEMGILKKQQNELQLISEECRTIVIETGDSEQITLEIVQIEEQLFRLLFKDYAQIIENKSLDTNTNKAKIKAWAEFHIKFNEINGRHRQLSQLKVQWKNMKLQARKSFSTFKIESNKTGGGARPATPSDAVIEIKDLLNPAELLRDHNIYDSDGIIPSSSENNVVLATTSDPENQKIADICKEIVLDDDAQEDVQETPLVISQDNATLGTPTPIPAKKVPKRKIMYSKIPQNGSKLRKEEQKTTKKIRQVKGKAKNGDTKPQKDERPACAVCSRRFASRAVLTRHARVHTGERPYRCGHCGLGFSQREVLRRHELVHREVRPFACAQCPKSFTQRAALAAHARTHEPRDAQGPVTLHRCTSCPKAFRHASGLSRHAMRHSGRLFLCPHCERRFNDDSSLRRHVRCKHARPPQEI